MNVSFDGVRIKLTNALYSFGKQSTIDKLDDDELDRLNELRCAINCLLYLSAENESFTELPAKHEVLEFEKEAT